MSFLQFDLKKYAEATVNIDMLLEHKDISDANIVFTDDNGGQTEYPMKVAVLNLKGLVNIAVGNKEMAKKAFEDALAISPNFNLAKTNLADLEK